jgi:hypothetical protein
MYGKWAAEVPPQDRADFDIELAMNVFVVLLSVISLEKELLLKKADQKKGGARRMIDLAFRKPRVDGFRATIITCWNPQRNVKDMIVSVQLTEEALRKDDNDQDGHRKHELLYSKASASMTICCENPSCNIKGDFKKFKDITLYPCPCKRVYYCQKSCQVSHWQEHNTSCAYQAERRKKKQHGSAD